MPIKNIKHQHGTPNPILIKEEEIMIAMVEKALASTSNPQIIGRNGEIPLLKFLKRYLPSTLRAETGHFLAPSGKLSPQIDIIILDSRYPLLAENEDGSVIAMLHSVISTIEVKTNITSGDMKKIWYDSEKIMFLASEIPTHGPEQWGGIMRDGFAYKCANKLDTLDDKYIQFAQPKETPLDIYLIRLHPSDQVPGKNIGAMLHFEPVDEEDEDYEDSMDGYVPTCALCYNPLSDLYYRLIQNSYYMLGSRNISFSDIGAHVMDYLAWSTFSWDEYWEMKEERKNT